jgi:uncharacterized membrane protein
MTDRGHVFREAEARLLEQLRHARRQARIEQPTAPPEDDVLTPGQRIADMAAATIGSWRFIIIQSIILFAWVVLNVTAWIQHWDPYPFILLNLMLSFQAAYAGPVIMMSQNRQQDVDRRKAENDYQVNIKAELEIELLHQKIDELREKEVLALSQAVNELCDLLKAGGQGPAASPR